MFLRFSIGQSKKEPFFFIAVKTIRLYNVEVIIYCERSKVVSEVVNIPYMNHYLVSPLHDKDLKKDGSLVAPHVHLYLNFTRNLSYKQVASFCSSTFGCTVFPENVAPVHTNFANCYFYSFHDNQTDKVLYSEADLVSDNFRFFKRGFQPANDTAYNIILDLESGVSLRLMAQKYGREFIINYSRYREFLMDMQHYEVVDRKLILSSEPSADVFEGSEQINFDEVFKNV